MKQPHSREVLGFSVAVGFVGVAAARDVYLGGLFQRVSPPLVVMVAFSACTVMLLPIALVWYRDSLAILWRHSRLLLWINFTSALAWLAFAGAIRFVEPCLAQIIYSGIGPLSVIWIDRHLSRSTSVVPLTRAERPFHLCLLASLPFAAAVALAGRSGAGEQPLGTTALGLILATTGGVAISIATTQCRTVNDAGVATPALLALRFPATVVAAVALTLLSPARLAGVLSWADAALVIATLLIVLASYVNQVAISLASPLTVRAVLASGPVVIFLFQIIEGRLSPSPYSLAAAIFYAVCAISVGLARHRAIHALDVSGSSSN